MCGAQQCNKYLQDLSMSTNLTIQMLQDKQKCLLRKMESVNAECDKLREQVLDLEEERDATISKLEAVGQKETNHERSFQDLQVTELTRCMPNLCV